MNLSPTYLRTTPTVGIKCGSFTNSGGTTVSDVGFKSGWILVKCTNNASFNWFIFDKKLNNWANYLSPNTDGVVKMEPDCH